MYVCSVVGGSPTALLLEPGGNVLHKMSACKEKASDLLEATMGLGWQFPDTWTVPRDHVDKVCCVMYELWSEHEWSQVWDLEVLVDEVLRRYFYDAWAYNTQDSVRRQRQAYATSGIFSCCASCTEDSILSVRKASCGNRVAYAMSVRQWLANR